MSNEIIIGAEANPRILYRYMLETCPEFRSKIASNKSSRFTGDDFIKYFFNYFKGHQVDEMMEDFFTSSLKDDIEKFEFPGGLRIFYTITKFPHPNAGSIVLIVGLSISSTDIQKGICEGIDSQILIDTIKHVESVLYTDYNYIRSTLDIKLIPQLVDVIFTYFKRNTKVKIYNHIK